MSVFLFVLLTMNQPPVPSPRAFDARLQSEMTLDSLAARLSQFDVVMFGEEHDNAAGHRFYADLANRLHQIRSDTVISMEMFERDVQGVVNDYVQGKIDESMFLKHSRPWKTYKEFYRPQIELAKQYRLDVIAGNLPRPVAGKISGSAQFVSPYLPRKYSTPKDAYWGQFIDAMKGHPGMDSSGSMIEGMYRAQCAKDDAMAESISDYFDCHPHRRPLVIHRCGKFHCEFGLGTVSRLLERQPMKHVAVITMVSSAQVAKPDLSKDWRKAHFLLVVPESEQPKPAEPKKNVEKNKSAPASKSSKGT